MSDFKKRLFLLFASLVLIIVGLQACGSDAPTIVAKALGTLPTFTPTVTPCTVKSTFGNSTVETSAGVNSGNVFANKYSFSGGTLWGFSLYTGGLGKYSMALYTDNGSGTAPLNLVVQSAAVSTTTAAAGWSTVNISPLAVPAGTYWLAFQTDNSVSTYYLFNSTSLPYIAQTFGSFPNSYTGYTPCSCSIMTMVGNYCP